MHKRKFERRNSLIRFAEEKGFANDSIRITPSEPINPFQQKEAFAMMTYRCEDCRLEERIWNSRPRVTPFSVTCARCSGTMNHVNWENDRFIPNYTPSVGQRVFVDLTYTDYLAGCLEMAKKYWAVEDDPFSVRDKFKTVEDLAKSMASDWTFGMPSLIEIKDYTNDR